MAKTRKGKTWSYTAGEKGRNRVRVYEEQRTGILMLEWYEQSGKRKRKSLGHRDKEKAKEIADRVAAELRRVAQVDGGSVTLHTLFDKYLREVTPTKGASKQRHDKRAARCFRAFFDAQPEASRRMSRHPSTLDRVDWDRFIEWRRAGKIPGWERGVGDCQVRHDLTFLISVLNWATGQKVGGQPILQRNPWDGSIRRSQNWQKPKVRNQKRPAMTDSIREKLIEHSPSWQFAAALRLGRLTGRRNSSIRQLLWSDIDFDAETVKWRADKDKVGRENKTPLLPEAVEILKGLPSRGIGDAPVFPSAEDPTQPTPDHTFQTWLQRAKRRWLRSIEDEGERRRVKEALSGLGFHGEKRAAVRDERFRKLPPKLQEALTGTNYDTLRRIYDEVSVEDQRKALAAVGIA